MKIQFTKKLTPNGKNEFVVYSLDRSSKKQANRPTNQNTDTVRKKVAQKLNKLIAEFHITLTDVQRRFLDDVAHGRRQTDHGNVATPNSKTSKVPQYHMAHNISIKHLIDEFIWRLNNPHRSPGQIKKDELFLDEFLTSDEETREIVFKYMNTVHDKTSSPSIKIKEAKELLYMLNGQANNLMPGDGPTNSKIGSARDPHGIFITGKDGKEYFIETPKSKKIAEKVIGFIKEHVLPKMKIGPDGLTVYMSSSYSKPKTYAHFHTPGSDFFKASKNNSPYSEIVDMNISKDSASENMGDDEQEWCNFYNDELDESDGQNTPLSKMNTESIPGSCNSNSYKPNYSLITTDCLFPSYFRDLKYWNNPHSIIRPGSFTDVINTSLNITSPSSPLQLQRTIDEIKSIRCKEDIDEYINRSSDPRPNRNSPYLIMQPPSAHWKKQDDFKSKNKRKKSNTEKTIYNQILPEAELFVQGPDDRASDAQNTPLSKMNTESIPGSRDSDSYKPNHQASYFPRDPKYRNNPHTIIRPGSLINVIKTLPNYEDVTPPSFSQLEKTLNKIKRKMRKEGIDKYINYSSAPMPNRNSPYLIMKPPSAHWKKPDDFKSKNKSKRNSKKSNTEKTIFNQILPEANFLTQESEEKNANDKIMRNVRLFTPLRKKENNGFFSKSNKFDFLDNSQWKTNDTNESPPTSPPQNTILRKCRLLFDSPIKGDNEFKSENLLNGFSGSKKGASFLK